MKNLNNPQSICIMDKKQIILRKKVKNVPKYNHFRREILKMRFKKKMDSLKRIIFSLAKKQLPNLKLRNLKRKRIHLN